MEYVNRRETGEAKNERPFYAKQKLYTIRKYSRVWVKVLRYIWRTGQRERGEGNRPDWTFTQQQERHFRSMVAAMREEGQMRQSQRQSQRRTDMKKNQEEMEEHCLHFWMTMFDHELKASEYESGIISALAVLGLDTEKGGWMPAENFTPLLSAIVTVTRAMVVYTAHKHREGAIQEGVQRGFDQRAAEEQAPSHFEVIRQMVHKFMTLTEFGGIPSPMDRMLHMRTYGMKIRYTTKGVARVSWEGGMVCIDKISFTLGDLRAVVHGLEETARQRLTGELMMADSSQMPGLDLQKLFDNAAEMAEEWNFLRDSRNEWRVNGHKWMWSRMFSEKEVETRFIQGGLEDVTSREEIRWNERRVEDYFRQVRRFKEELFVLVHMTAGAPARGTEIISIQHENGELSRAQRGIFIDRGMVQFVTSYHKGYSASQKVKIIHRYVPQEVGELVVYYIWLVEPFVRILQSMVRGQEDFSAFLWEPEEEEEWVEDEDGEEGEDEGEIERGEQGVNEEDDDVLEGGSGDRQIRVNHRERESSQREERVKEAKNVDGFWNTDRVRKVMSRETEDRIGVRITTAIWRQVYPAIQREWSKEKGVGEMLDSIYNQGTSNTREGEGGGEGDASSRQAGHSKRMEEMIYGLLLSESPFYIMSEREEFRKVSQDWHRLLHFRSAWEDEKVSGDVRKKIEEEQERQAF